jgi:hypothetical protein
MTTRHAPTLWGLLRRAVINLRIAFARWQLSREADRQHRHPTNVNYARMAKAGQRLSDLYKRRK